MPLIESRFPGGAGFEVCQRTGRLRIDGVGLERLIAAAPTPCYVYSADRIREQYRKLRAALPGFDVCYSVKANPNPAICRLLREQGAGAEVSSEQELATALGAGMPAGDTVLVGPAKTDAELRRAIEQGIQAIVADCPEDLERVDALAVELGRDPAVLLRVNTREQPEAREVMVGGPSKFGFDEELVADQVRQVRLRQARIAGIQVYSASQVLDGGIIAAHLEYVAGLATRLASEIGFELQAVDFGGGFGVAYAEDEQELDLGPVAERGREVRHRLGGCRLLVESGRFLVAEAGVFLTTVQRVKESRGRRIVITDGGMNSFARPVFMRVRHPVRLVSRLAEAPAGEYDVCGPICTPIDCLAKDVRLPEPRPRDIIGLFSAGAYGWSMSLLKFMSRGRPGELLADAGKVTVIR